MESTNPNLNLVCVLFPGVVKDEEKALQCLGGIRNISQVFTQPNAKRLGISFHPDNPYAKKTYADVKDKAGVLFKVKVKKTFVNNVPQTVILSTSVVGRVNKIFKFEALCDYQYLPIQTGSSKSQSTRCILEQILPSGMESFDYLLKPGPLFVVPSHFSRHEKGIEYSYTDKKSFEKNENSDSEKAAEDNVLKKNRATRSLPNKCFNFSMSDNLPTKPHEFFINLKQEKLKVSPKLQNEFEAIKKMFEERPIWSVNLIKYHSKVRVPSIKIILPCLAVTMKSGPWKLLWIRFGYDPRKNPEARKYQIFDFRVRLAGGFKALVTHRDSDLHLHKTLDRTKNRLAEEVKEGAVYYRPGMIPAQRQIFYQYCDVKVPEIEELIGREPLPGAKCHPNHGWLPADTQELCRDHLCNAIMRSIQATNITDVSFEQGSSEDSNSEGEDSNIQSMLDEPSTSYA